MAERTRNGGKDTEAKYWGKVRSALRKAFAYWTPAEESMRLSRREREKGNGRHRFEYECAVCGGWFRRTEVQADHVVPVGSLKCLDDLPGFLERLTPEDTSAFQCVCKDCHKAKTKAERERRNGNRQ